MKVAAKNRLTAIGGESPTNGAENGIELMMPCAERGTLRIGGAREGVGIGCDSMRPVRFAAVTGYDL